MTISYYFCWKSDWISAYIRAVYSRRFGWHRRLIEFSLDTLSACPRAYLNKLENNQQWLDQQCQRRTQEHLAIILQHCFILNRAELLLICFWPATQLITSKIEWHILIIFPSILLISIAFEINGRIDANITDCEIE